MKSLPSLLLAAVSLLVTRTGPAQAADFQVTADPAFTQSPACRDFLDYNENKIHTYGLFASKQGKPRLELYGRGASERSLFKLWSVSKTFTSLLLGTEIHQGRLTLDTKVASVLPGYPHVADLDPGFRSRIRVRHLWTFSSGLDWCESETCDASHLFQLYYGQGHRDSLAFLLGLSVVSNPGTTYRYGSADVTILSGMLKALHTPEEYDRLPETALFGPLGIERWVLEKDDKGVYLSGADLFLATRDLAKLGQLILQKGRWEGRELFSQAYYDEMLRPSYAIRSADTSDEDRDFEGPVGGLVWTNSAQGGLRPFLRASPDDVIYSSGNFGQFLLVYPSAGVVVARNGGDADFSDMLETFAEKATKCFAPDEWRDPSKFPPPKKPAGPLVNTLKMGLTLASTNVAARLMAQEYCDCLYLGAYAEVGACDQLLPEDTLKNFFPARPEVNRAGYSVKVQTGFKDPTGLLKKVPRFSAEAVFDPRSPHDGCHLR